MPDYLFLVSSKSIFISLIAFFLSLYSLVCLNYVHKWNSLKPDVRDFDGSIRSGNIRFRKRDIRYLSDFPHVRWLSIGDKFQIPKVEGYCLYMAKQISFNISHAIPIFRLFFLEHNISSRWNISQLLLLQHTLQVGTHRKANLLNLTFLKMWKNIPPCVYSKQSNTEKLNLSTRNNNRSPVPISRHGSIIWSSSFIRPCIFWKI